MTARFFGTVQHDHGGRTLTLVLDLNAICHFDDATGLNFFSAAEAWQTGAAVPSAGELRALVHAALQAHHADVGIEEAGRILSEDFSIFERLTEAATEGMASDGESGRKKTGAATR